MPSNTVTPLECLLRMRTVIDDAIEATQSFHYEDLNEQMRVMRTRAREIFLKFDEYFSD